MVSRSRITAPLIFTLALPAPNNRHGQVHARPPPSKSSPHDGGKVRKKRRLVKLRDQLPPSEDNNKKLSDLSATDSSTDTHLVVAQISGPPAKSHAMPPTVSESQLSQTLADLHALAVDFFHKEDHNAPAVVKHVFGTFRSMVYRKSLYNTSGDAHRPLSVVESEPSLVPLRTIPKAVDRPSTGRKRAKSDSSEEPSAKGINKQKMLEAVTKPKPSQQFGSEKDVVEQKLKQKLGSTKKKVVNTLTALQQAELQPMSSESAAVRVAAELPKNHVDKTETEKSGIVKAAALPARQPAELPPVKKIVDVKLQKSCIKKADEKGNVHPL